MAVVSDLQTALAKRNQELQVMVDQAASRPTASSANNTAPSMRVDLREETVMETATPGAPGLGQRMSLDLGQTMKMRGMNDLGQVCLACCIAYKNE